MPRRLLLYLFAVGVFLLPASPLHARERVQGWCEEGGNTLTVVGLETTDTAQQSFPGCTVTVWDAGTTDIASIFSDDVGTVKANPFTADGTTGLWSFYADNARYDVQLSGGGIAAPFTLSDFLLDDSAQMVTTIAVVASSATPVFDVGKASILTNILTANVTSSTITNGVTGQIITIYIAQDAIGGRTFVWPANVQLRGGGYVVSDDASAVSTIKLYFDGTNWREIGIDSDEIGRSLIAVNNAVQNLGSLTSRWNGIFGQTLDIATTSILTGNITFGASVLPTATGQDIGAVGARPDGIFDVMTVGLWNNVRVVDGNKFTTIQGAISDLTTGNGTVFILKANYAPTSTISVSQPNITIIADAGAIITATGIGAPLLEVTTAGTGFRLIGGIWDGNSATTLLKGVIQIEANNCLIEGADIRNGTGLGILLRGASDCIVTKNRFSGNVNSPIGIFGESGRHSRNNLVEGNVVGPSVGGATADSIQVIGSFAGSDVSGTRIIGNDIEVNNTAAFGIELGAFVGDSPDDIVISNNVIRATGASFGGISVGSITGGSITGNSFDSGGFVMTIAGIEVGESTNVSVTGNRIKQTSTAALGISIDKSSQCTVSGNIVDGFGNASTEAGIFFNVSGSAANARRNTIVGNVIIFPTTTNAGVAYIGIALQANFAGSDVSDNVISSNIIVGNGDTAIIGINMQHDSGTLANTMVSGNFLRDLNIGISRDSGQTGAILVWNTFANVTTNFGGTAGTGEVAGSYDQINARFLFHDTVIPILDASINLGVNGARWLNINGVNLNINGITNLANISADGVGVKHKRIVSCTTAASQFATCTSTWTFTTAMSNTAYTPICTMDNPTNLPIIAHTTNRLVGSIDIVVMAMSAAAASGSISCVAVHD